MKEGERYVNASSAMQKAVEDFIDAAREEGFDDDSLANDIQTACMEAGLEVTVTPD